MRTTPAFLLGALGAASCMSTQPEFGTTETVDVRIFETDGDDYVRIKLTNANGMEVHMTNLGATVTAVRVPDRDGEFADVVLGFDDLDRYLSADNQYFGCTVGRVANRIEKGTFELDGERYTLATNNDPNHLHGGAEGFGVKLWSVERAGPGAVRFELVSEDGDEGYPGRLEVAATYVLTDDDVLAFELTARTDAATPVSLTNHAYWNLAGHGASTVLDHELELRTGRYTPTDATLIPTGEIEEVTDALDFRTAKPIGRDVHFLVNTPTKGYDHNFVLAEVPRRTDAGVAERLAARDYDARLVDPASGRFMELTTDQPGLQFYSGNFLFGQTGKGGATYALHSACCLEPQGIPDAINEPRFPSVVLRPGEVYRHTTALRFGAH